MSTEQILAVDAETKQAEQNTSFAKMQPKARKLSLYLLIITLPNLISIVDCAQLGGKSEVERTADLTTLINETLAINNKTLAPAASVSPAGGPLKDDWTFDMVEYDLIEFLQDLSARYQLANKTTNQEQQQQQQSSPLDLNGELQAKREPPSEKVSGTPTDQISTSSSTATATATTTTTTTTSSPAPSVTTTLALKETQSSSSPSESLQTADRREDFVEESSSKSSGKEQKIQSKFTTKTPLLSTSLASMVGDHEISESKWQYGIFDRFTRPKSTTTTPAPDLPPLVLDENGQIDSRNFNGDECGLRTYDEQSRYYPESSQFIDEQADAIKDLSQRRQRLPANLPLGQFKKTNPFSGSSSLDDELDRNNEKLAYDSYKENKPAPGSGLANEHQSAYPPTGGSGIGGSESSSSSSSSLASNVDNEFNLASRRQWLQQQLGNTLQLLGFNATSSQSISDYFNETSNGGGSGMSARRENMMKKSGKVAKSAAGLDDVESPGGSSAATATAHMPQKQPPVGSSFQENLASVAAAVREDDSKNLAHHEKLAARQDELKLEARVIGGSDARLGDSPWSVSLQALVSRPGTGGIEYRHYCGGTIISEYYVLTAAHCLDFMVGRESRLFVVIGDLNWRMSAASLYGRRFGIEKLIIHSGYKSTAFGHDIGLIKVKESMRPVKVNGRYIINSVCLPEKGIEHTGEAELVGWGLFSNRNEMADSLQIADVPILPRPLCVDLYRRRTGLIQWLIGIELITEKQVCAGTFGRGICQGDSGSALVFNEKVTSRRHLLGGNGNAAIALGAREARQRKRVGGRTDETRATIIGIVAFGGIRRCSYQSLPGVYMQTSKYMDWIVPRIQN